MGIFGDLHARQLNRIERKLDILIGGEAAILHKENLMSAAIDRIVASVTDITNKDDSIIALVGSLAQEVRDGNTSNDPAINALADQLDASSAKVLAAVNANTPAAPAA